MQLPKLAFFQPAGVTRMPHCPGRFRHLSYAATLLLTTCVFLASAPAAHAQWLDALRNLDHNHAKVTAMVVDLDDMSTIAALHPDKRLTPASVSKLFATAGALEQFGPDHRFVTRFASAGRVADGVLHGDLVFIGGGDPMLDTRDLRALIQR